MKAVLLGAGYGTRLYPLTKDRPKTLLPIAGKPMVEWILGRLAAVPGLDGVALVTNDRFAGHHERWLAQAKPPLPVTLVNDGTKSDADKLGAVGDIRLTRDRLRLDDDLLVVAGDNLFELDVAAFAAFFREKQAPVIALKDMKGSSLISRYSVVTLDAYFAQGGNPDAPGYYIQWLCRQTAAYGWVFDAPWFDIGDIDSYNEANARYGSAQAGR